MENQNRTVANFSQQSYQQKGASPQSQPDVSLTRYHATYIELLGINVAHAFPVNNLTDEAVNMISIDSLEAASKLCTIVSKIAEDTFFRLSQEWQKQGPNQQLREVAGR